MDRARVDVVLRLQVDAIAGTEEVGMRDLTRDQEALRPRITDTELHAARRTFLDLEADIDLIVGARHRLGIDFCAFDERQTRQTHRSDEHTSELQSLMRIS